MFKNLLLVSFFLAVIAPFSSAQKANSASAATQNRVDTIKVSIANKKSVNGYLEFDVMVQGSHLRGNTGNYLSSLEVELDYNPTMFAHNLANEIGRAHV